MTKLMSRRALTLLACLAASAAFAAEPPAPRKAAIFVKNTAGDALNDKVAFLEDQVASRIAGKDFAIISREEVVEFERPTHLAYVLLAGLPISNYRADVRLTSLGERRTRILWIGTFESKGVTGAIMKRVLRFVLSDFVRRLSKVAPKRS